MQPYKQSISRDGTHNKPEVDWTNAARLLKELAGIYSTPTPKGGTGPKK